MVLVALSHLILYLILMWLGIQKEGAVYREDDTNTSSVMFYLYSIYGEICTPGGLERENVPKTNDDYNPHEAPHEATQLRLLG